MSGNYNLGWFGKISDQTRDLFYLKFDTYVAEINLDKLQEMIPPLTKHTNISNYPFVKFDLSFELTNEVAAQDLLGVVHSTFPDFENSSYIFDEYFDPENNKRTIGIRVKLRSYVQTIRDEELIKIRHSIIKEITTTFPANLKDNE
jgi:phenylalanyl-tRNA synthetase beta subunit